MSDEPSVDAVVFDLGGVLVGFGGVGQMQRLTDLDAEEVVRRWLACPWVRRFESGRCSPAAFARGVVDDWGLPVTPDVFLESFATWPDGLLEGAEALVADTARASRVACLSNTNEVHWEAHATRWQLDALFETTFLSHHTGLVKPDAATYRHVLDVLALQAERVLVLDDAEPNVAGARSVGLRASRVRGPGEARRALVDHGLLVA